MIPCAWKRKIVVLLLVSSLITFVPRTANACGPFFTDAIFVFQKHPDLPLESFARGRIGVLQPTYARSYLVAAYRNLTGASLSEDEVKGISGLWNERLSSDWSYEDWLKKWRDARSKVPGVGEGTDISVYRDREKPREYESFLNCQEDAFQNAIATLGERARTFGADSAAVRNWVAAQDIVFSNCGGGAQLPQALPETDALSRADRAYQIAAANFYATKFDDATKQFDAIAGDASSPWRTIAPYLAARALLRKGSLAAEPEPGKAALADAEKRLKSIIEDRRLEKSHHAARRLLNLTRLRLHPEETARDLAVSPLKTLRELRVIEAFFRTIGVVILAGTALVVGNTFVMAIAERTREIGILMAVGWTPCLGPTLGGILTLAGSHDTIYQGMGLADALITRLSNVRELKVRPSSAVLDFENQSQDSISFGRKSDVDAVLEGTIYRTPDKLRITARLVRVADESVLWSGQFERFVQDELRIQNEIATQMVDALALNLKSNERDALTKRHTENVDAYQLYVKGRYEWNKRSWAGAIEAERLFRNAIEQDPGFALAYVGLADVLMMSPANAPHTIAAVEKALELDPNLAEAHATLGFISIFHQWNWPQAETALRKSIELNPGYASAHHWYAQLLTIQGRHEEAKSEMQVALQINPLSHNFLADLGQIYYFNREYRKAEEYCRKALEVYPEFEFAHKYLFYIYLKTGEHDKAAEAIIAADKAHGALVHQSAEYRKQAERREATYRKIYDEEGIRRFIERRIQGIQDGTACSVFSNYYAFLGEKEKALTCLEKSYEARSLLLAFVRADPIFDDLRAEPRYRELLRKMNLPN